MNKILLFLLSAAVALCAQERIYASFDVAAAKDAQLALKAVGIVKTVNVEIGSAVKRGDVLLELENESEKLAVRLAQNDLESAQTAKAHAKSVLDKFKLVQSVSSKQAFENAEFDFKNAALAENRAHLALNLAQKRLGDTRLLAPFDGTISGKSIEVGEGVGGVAQKLMSIFSYPDVKLKLSFDEKFKDRVKIGSEFIYKLDGQIEERRGKISLIYPTIDTKNGKIYAEVQARNLTPGLFGEGYIVSSAQDGDATSDKKAAAPKNKDANLVDANKTSELKFGGSDGAKKSEFAATGAKFDAEKTGFGAVRFLNLRAQTKSEVNLSSNSAFGVKFDAAIKNADLTNELESKGERVNFAEILSLSELGLNFTNLANHRFKKTSQAALDLNLVRRPNGANLNSQAKFCAGQNSDGAKNPPQSLNLIKNQTAPFVPNLPQITASSENSSLLGRQDFATKKLELNLTSHRLAQAVLNFSQNANLIGKLNFLRAASLRSNLIRRANFINVAKEFKNESVMAFVLNSAQGRVGADLNLQSNFNPTKKSEPNLSQTASFGLNSAQRPNFSPNANRSKKQILSFVPNLPLVLALNENPNSPQKPVLSKARNV
ncbi:efflux RND transporter periplasmic adaptor subunit [Campylobacter rectus]